MKRPLKSACTKQLAKAMNNKSVFHTLTSQLTRSLLKIAEVVSQQRGRYAPTFRSRNSDPRRGRVVSSYHFCETELRHTKLLTSLHSYFRTLPSEYDGQATRGGNPYFVNG
jgi:hypothetical protein